MRRILTLLITLFFCIHSYGIEPYIVNFKNIDNKIGLSQNGITTIFQDRDGYMWFGTHYGLNRYDGINITSFYSGNSFNELSDNTINSITQDLAGNIWIATEQGLTVYNPITHKLFNLKNQTSYNYSYFPILVDDLYPETRDELYFRLKEVDIFSRRYFVYRSRLYANS